MTSATVNSIDGVAVVVSKGVKVFQLGTIEQGNDNFTVPQQGGGKNKGPILLPVSYVCKRDVPIPKDQQKTLGAAFTEMRLEIEREGDHPVFALSTPLRPDLLVRKPSCGAAVAELLAAVNLPSSTLMSGHLLTKFGLGDDVIAAEIAKLPGAAAVLSAGGGTTKSISQALKQAGATSHPTQANGSAGLAASTSLADLTAELNVVTAPAKGKSSKKPLTVVPEAVAKAPAPKKAKPAPSATAPVAPIGICPLCNVSMSMPFCAMSGKQHEVPAATPGAAADNSDDDALVVTIATAADEKKPKAAKAQKPSTVDKSAKKKATEAAATPNAAGKRSKQPTLAEATAKKATDAVVETAARRSKSRSVTAVETSQSAAAAVSSTDAKPKPKRGKRTQEATLIEELAAAAAVAAAAATNGAALDVDSDEDDVVDVDEDDRPMVLAVTPALAAPKPKVPRTERKSTAMTVVGEDGMPIVVPKKPRGKKGASDGSQPTLDGMLVKVTSLADATDAMLTATAAQMLPPEPKKPKVQVLRALLDPSSNKAARAQYDAEGGLAATNVPELATMTKAQLTRFHNFVFEFLGERGKLDLIKRRPATATTTNGATTAHVTNGDGAHTNGHSVADVAAVEA